MIANPASAIVYPEHEAAFQAARQIAEPALGADSQPDAAVPKGRLIERRHVGKGVYPDVARNYSVYIPAQYQPGSVANLMVFQDARFYLPETFNATVVFDNLIARGEIAPLIGVFVEPGDLPDAEPNTRGNRSLEYDAMNDAYSRFLLEELLPEALEGLDVSADPADRAICGISSGGICAFNVAWHRPDAFGKVVSHVGSFADIRGGHLYPSLVRKAGRKPIRTFLQGGANDLDNLAGSWAVANWDMAAALKFRGYDYRLEFGVGGHDLKHGAAVFPQTMRWLWRGE